MIKHMVLFNLKHQEGSLEEQLFLLCVQDLALIPEVNDLEISLQISQKSPFKYCLSMTFENPDAYQEYRINEIHENFVKIYWLAQVTGFMELDLVTRKTD